MMVSNSFLHPYSKLSLDPLQYLTVKLLDWGEEGHRTQAEIASLRAAFTQEVAVWHKLDHPNVTRVRFTFPIGLPCSKLPHSLTPLELVQLALLSG